MIPKDEYIINLALTGVIPTKKMNSNVPITHEEILSDVKMAIQHGVQMVHLHARDENGFQSSNPELYARLTSDIRKIPGGKDLIVCVTTSGRIDSGFASRSKVLDLTGDEKPDMASLTLSSLNFSQSASVNSPDVIRALAKKMLENGIKPELEVFDLGMVNFIKVLKKERLIEPPFYINILLGNISGAQATPIELGALMCGLPEESVVSIAGIGDFQLKANLYGLLEAQGVRIGLEDNIWQSRKLNQLASNESLLKRMISLAENLEKKPVPTPELRNILFNKTPNRSDNPLKVNLKMDEIARI